MTTPVVVSRIQNRRGTHSQFLSLYPPGYTGVGGYALSQPATPSTAASGDGTTATILFSASPIAIYSVGDSIAVSGIVPVEYNGVHVVTASTATSVSYASTATGAQTVAGTITKPFNTTNYPNILMPGEIALCTDSRSVFVGNLNGEYLEIETVKGDGVSLLPSSWVLPPSPTFVPVTKILPGGITVALEYDITPFFSIVYDITDTQTPDWNAVGNNFSKNGELTITAINVPPVPPVNVPPLPPFEPVTLTDEGTEINLLHPADIYFKAQYNGPKIEILYMHDMPPTLGNPGALLTLNTSTINWLPLL